MNNQELRLAIRKEVESLIKEHPEIFAEIRNQRLDEGLVDWLKSIKAKVVDAFSGIGGKEEIEGAIEADPNGGWLTKIRQAVMPSQAYKEMLKRVQEIVDQMGDSAPPATGLVTAGKKVDGDVLQESSFEEKIAAKRQKPNFLASVATVIMIISFFSDKVLLVSDMWWVVICVGLIGINALSKIMVSMAKGKMNLQTAKMQMAQQAGIQPSQLQAYIAEKAGR